MAPVENFVQQCVEYLHPIFTNLAENIDDVISRPLDSNSFTPELLQFQWKPLLEAKISNPNPDALIDLVLKRIIVDAMTNESDENSNAHIKRCAVVLDFCFHSKANRKKAEAWSSAFFDLFSAMLDLLSWPAATLEFWPYAESRMHWFKMGNSLTFPHFGTTNLISYKQPLYDKLRHWNDILNTVHNRSSLNTPLDNIMCYKLTKFVSELLPIHEESNFNRSALISKRQGSGNPWNRTISSARKGDNSSENVFAIDYNYVFDNLLSCPLEFAFQISERKADIDKVLVNLLDNVFETEEEFYKQMKKSQKSLVEINDKINYRYPCDFGKTDKEEPNYVKNSTIIKKDRAMFWDRMMSLRSSAVDMLQPTMLDISTENPNTLYMQMMDTDNDFYRKQFVLQVYFIISIVRQVVTVPEVENFYKTCYQKEKPSRSINFDNLDESNRKKTSLLCNHILDGRIAKFYHNRDPQFASLISRLAVKDTFFLDAKVDGFKIFQNFNTSYKPIDSPKFDYGFKGFGFIEMGNKLVNNVWKINSGLDFIKRRHESPKTLYESMREKFNKGELDNTDNEKEPADKIIKEWQCLRSLRSQYLFEFNKVDENVGIKGLFDPSSIVAENNKKRVLLSDILLEINKPHVAKLEEARNYIAQKQNKKRAHDEELEQNAQKKTKSVTENGRKQESGEEIQQPTSEPSQASIIPVTQHVDMTNPLQEKVMAGETSEFSASVANEITRENPEQELRKAEGADLKESTKLNEQARHAISSAPGEDSKEEESKDDICLDIHDAAKLTATQGDHDSAPGGEKQQAPSISPEIECENEAQKN